MKWQDIKTAPTSGRILATDGKDVEIVLPCERSDGKIQFFVDHEEDDLFQATKWMPLPDPV